MAVSVREEFERRVLAGEKPREIRMVRDVHGHASFEYTFEPVERKVDLPGFGEFTLSAQSVVGESRRIA